MAISSKSANAKFYEQQRLEFLRMDRDCQIEHMTRSAYKEAVRYYDSVGAVEQYTAYGCSRGSRGVLLRSPQWPDMLWVMFLD